MNYIQQINGYWTLKKLCRVHGFNFKPYHDSLYYALLHVNNRCYWKEWFSLTLSEGKSLSGLSKPTYYKSLYQLEEMGLIKLRGKGDSRAPIEISLIQWGKYIDPENRIDKKRGQNIASTRAKELPPTPEMVAIYCHILKQEKTRKQERGDFLSLGEGEQGQKSKKPPGVHELQERHKNGITQKLPKSTKRQLS